jgi:hypothetical protein
MKISRVPTRLSQPQGCAHLGYAQAPTAAKFEKTGGGKIEPNPGKPRPARPVDAKKRGDTNHSHAETVTIRYRFGDACATDVRPCLFVVCRTAYDDIGHSRATLSLTACD